MVTTDEICVRGRVGEEVLATIGLRAEVARRQTVLDGPLTDQAALCGPLGQLQALGIAPSRWAG